jgi:23S rRNA pseudouridine1911/1915/1917 synthase
VESLRFTVTKDDVGKRLDLYLTQVLNGQSRSQIQKLITDEKVLVGGIVVHKNTRLVENAILEISCAPIIQESYIKPQEIQFGIVYEDEHLVIVNKPAGLVVHPGSGVRDGTLVNGLVNRIQSLSEGSASDRPGIVHRLDKETSGVLIVAKTNQAHAAMASLFENRKVEKKYIGFCIGAPAEIHGSINFSLARSHQDPLKRAISPHGKEARTEYTIIQTKSGISAVSFKPYTGRTHQIRVHSSAKGFPIVADKLYGGGKEHLLRIDPLDRPFAYSILKCFQRHALHAFSIEFIHPFTNTKLVVTAPLPQDFETALLRFGSMGIFDDI